MAKRFIDTGLFDDDWFMELSKDAKILWLYFITNCDHAGIIKLNSRLCSFQTKIKDLGTVREQLGNRIVTVREQLFFIPKFVEFQYPGFPNCNFNMAKSAISILEKYGLIKNSKLTVDEQLVNSNGNGNGNSNKKGDYKGETLNVSFETFWNLYDKKVDRKKCEPKWNRLTDTERSLCITKLPAYIQATPDKKFRRDPETYLNNKSWENEIINPMPIKVETIKTYDEMVAMTEKDPDVWNRYTAEKRPGERKAIFIPKNNG